MKKIITMALMLGLMHSASGTTIQPVSENEGYDSRNNLFDFKRVENTELSTESKKSTSETVEELMFQINELLRLSFQKDTESATALSKNIMQQPEQYLQNYLQKYGKDNASILDILMGVIVSRVEGPMSWDPITEIAMYTLFGMVSEGIFSSLNNKLTSLEISNLYVKIFKDYGYTPITYNTSDICTIAVFDGGQNGVNGIVIDISKSLTDTKITTALTICDRVLRLRQSGDPTDVLAKNYGDSRNDIKNRIIQMLKLHIKTVQANTAEAPLLPSMAQLLNNNPDLLKKGHFFFDFFN
jgi:hypothetical protein